MRHSQLHCVRTTDDVSAVWSGRIFSHLSRIHSHSPAARDASASCTQNCTHLDGDGGGATHMDERRMLSGRDARAGSSASSPWKSCWDAAWLRCGQQCALMLVAARVSLHAFTHSPHRRARQMNRSCPPDGLSPAWARWASVLVRFCCRMKCAFIFQCV